MHYRVRGEAHMDIDAMPRVREGSGAKRAAILAQGEGAKMEKAKATQPRGKAH